MNRTITLVVFICRICLLLYAAAMSTLDVRCQCLHVHAACKSYNQHFAPLP